MGGNAAAGCGWIAAVDIGGSQCRVAMFSPEGALRLRHVRRLEVDETAAALVGRVRADLAAMERQVGAPYERVGISLPGPLDPASGRVRRAFNLGWADVDLPALWAKAGGTAPLAVDDDARCAALGEAWRGTGGPRRHLAALVVGTGVGTGLVLDGTPYRGAHGEAGELGHIIVEPGGDPCRCGRRGCLETVAAGPAVLRRARAAGAAWADLPDGVRRLAAGETAGREAVRSAGRAVGQAIAWLAQVLDLDRVAVGGGAGIALWPEWRASIGEAVAQQLGAGADRLTVGPVTLGDDAGLYGAAELARRSAGPGDQADKHEGEGSA
jgi:glucokinase